MSPPDLLKEFEVIKDSLDRIADAYTLTTDNTPQFADTVTAVDRLCKILMRSDFTKENQNEDRANCKIVP